MPTRKEKEIILNDLTEKVKDNKGMILTEYQGLTVVELSELRAKLRPLNCEYKVVKNTLSRKALKEIGLEDFSRFFNGPTAIAIEKGDPVVSTKALVDFSKEHAKLKLKAGILGKKLLTADDVKALASLPSREVLIAHVLGTMKSPISGLVNVLQGSIRNMVYVLRAVRDKQEKAAGAQ